MLKKALLDFFNHDRPELNSVRSRHFNEIELVEIGDPFLDRTPGIEKRVFQHPARLSFPHSSFFFRHCSIAFCQEDMLALLHAAWPGLGIYSRQKRHGDVQGRAKGSTV
ncbi:MAG: hypothetical protein ACYC4A_11840 [Desulfobulbia bacterium]